MLSQSTSINAIWAICSATSIWLALKVYQVFCTERRKRAWKQLNLPPDGTIDGLYDAHNPVNDSHVRLIDTLAARYLPISSEHDAPETARGRRLIFIGDIHGCFDELEALLSKAKYNPARDHIIATGDIVNKGPKSLEVIDLLIREHASCVRGNHDDKVIRASSLLMTDRPDVIKRKENELARSIPREQMNWLRSHPIILRVGNIAPYGEVVVVHGGLLAGLSLEKQDAASVMNMRSVDLSSHTPSKEHAKGESVPWYQFWNDFQKLTAESNSWPLSNNRPYKKHSQTTVVYGHDSKRGLQMHKFTKGLDTGCVNGGELTAWIVSDHGKSQIIQQKSAYRGREKKTLQML